MSTSPSFVVPVTHTLRTFRNVLPNRVPIPQRDLTSLPRSRNKTRFTIVSTTAKPREKGRSGLRPKQSLGQNFLRDRNTARRVVSAFADTRAKLCAEARVVEVGPGLGALTGELLVRTPDLRAIEIDQRAVAKLQELHPGVDVHHGDVLDTEWGELSRELGGSLAVIGNLPYNIVSQILLSLFEAPPGAVSAAVVMMQREVADRLVASTRCKAYGILSVVGQLYSRPRVLFQVPPTAFYPVPDVTSALVEFEFRPMDGFDVSDVALRRALKRVVKTAFNQRRKVLKNSLRTVCEDQGVEVPARWADKRAEELTPIEFVELTEHVMAPKLRGSREGAEEEPSTTTVWR